MKSKFTKNNDIKSLNGISIEDEACSYFILDFLSLQKFFVALSSQCNSLRLNRATNTTNSSYSLYHGLCYVKQMITMEMSCYQIENIIKRWQEGVEVDSVSYKGYLLGLLMIPLGICIDAISHTCFLMCALNTGKVMMIDKDGQFLSHFMITINS